MINSISKWIPLFVLMVAVSALGIACGAAPQDAPQQPAAQQQPAAAAQPVAAENPAAQPAAPEKPEARPSLPIKLGEGGAVSTPVPGAKPAAVTVSADAIKRGGILNQSHRRSPLHFRMDVDAATDQASAVHPIFNQLVAPLPPDFTTIGPDLAESWEVSEDGRTFTFNLVPNIVNHKGNPWTSSDAKFTLETMATETENRPPHLSVSVAGVSTLESVKTPNDTTLVVRLTQQDGLFLSNLSIGWSSMHTEADYDEVDSLDNPVGTGPFFLESHLVGEKLEYRANPNYFKEGLPYLDGIDTFIIRDVAAKLAAFEAQRIDVVMMGSSHGLHADNLAALAKRHPGELTFYAGQHTTLRGVRWNWREEGPWQDVRVRRAIHLALDRDEICDAIPSCIVGDWGPSGVFGITDRTELEAKPGYAKTGPAKDAELAEAKKLLTDAGFPDGFEVKSLCRDTSEYRDHLCPLMEFLLRDKLNIRLELDVQETGAYTEKLDTGDWLVMTGASGNARVDHPFDWLDHAAFCGEAPAVNETGYCNEEFDELLRKMRVTSDVPELIALHVQAIDLFNTEIPYVPLFWPARWPVAWNYIKNLPDEHFSGQYSQARRFEETWLDR